MTDDTFGFGEARKPSTAEKLKAFRPDPSTEPAVPMEKIDAAAAAHGFVAREVARPVISRRRKEIGPTLAINMRVPERVAVPFIQFCEDGRLSYWEGVEELMKRSGLLAR